MSTAVVFWLHERWCKWTPVAGPDGVVFCLLRRLNVLFWHLGASLWLFRWIFRDPKVDIRFLLLGALIPDLVDMPIGTLILRDRYSTSELWAHSLVAASIYMSVVLIATRRGRRRRAWMALGVGWLFHLLLDGMWLNEDVLFWPFLGWSLPSSSSAFWPDAWQRALTDPWRWVLEAIGTVYLWWLWRALGLGDRDRREAVARTGRLPGYAGDAT